MQNHKQVSRFPMLEFLRDVVASFCAWKRTTFRRENRNRFAVGEVQSSDLPALSQIHGESFADKWSDGALESMLAHPIFFGLVARKIGGGRKPPLGFLLVRSVAGEAEIITIAVGRHSRQKGVASALMNELLRRLRVDDVKELFLEVREDNRAAIHLYRRLGFLKVADRVGYYRSDVNQPDQRTNALVMKLELG